MNQKGRSGFPFPESGEARHSTGRAFFLIAVALVGNLVATQSAGAATLDHFVWGVVATPQQQGVPFTVTLRAVDVAGNLVSNFTGTTTVSAEILSPPTLVISEVDNGPTNQVEFTNPSTNAVDASGWSIVFYDASQWPQPATSFTVPAGTICPPLSPFLVAAGGNAPGVFPNFSIGAPLRWTQVPSQPAFPIAVLLLNQTNGLVDFFCASTGYPFLITNPFPIIPKGWSGGSVTLFTSNPQYTFQRQGDFNHRQAGDWLQTGRSIGALNPTLSLPFTSDYAGVALAPSSVSVTNGIWSGFLSVEAAGSNVVLHADNEGGSPGVSNPFNVLAGSNAALVLPTQTFDNSPGVQSATITVPTTVGTDLVFNLASSAPSKIGVPSTVVVTSGTTSTEFNLTNFNDGILDGIQFVSITASNYLFPIITGVITNYSASVELVLTLPNTVNQQSGAMTGQAQLSTSVAVGPNFQAELFSSNTNLLVTPAFVQIPSGQTNARFIISSPNAPEVLGNRVVTVTAFAGPASTTNGFVTVSGSPATNLALFIPSQLIEGTGVVSNAIVSISGILTTNLTISLTSSTPGSLQVPSTVVLPAGQTSIEIPATLPSNSIAGPDVSVFVSVSAPGFMSATGAVAVLDNHLDHFTFAGIPPAQSINEPFAVSILAQNQSGDTLPGFSGIASLMPIRLPPGTVVPTQTSNFTNGVWIGNITVTTLATNMAVSATSGPVSGQSNPFDVGSGSIIAVSSAVVDLTYDPGTDRIYATIPATDGVGPNTVMRLNPYSATVDAYIPVDINPGLIALSASNQFLYVGVQNGYSVQRVNLATQAPDLEFAIPGDYALTLIGLPNSPGSVAIEGANGDYIFDGAVARTNLADLALVPGIDYNGIYNGGSVYLQNGLAINPTNQQTLGKFPVSGVVATRPVVPDASSGSIFFLTQQNGQTTIYAYNISTFILQGAQTIPGVIGTAANLVRWGTNGLAFSTTGNQLFVIHSALLPGSVTAQLSVSQNGPGVANIGSNITYTITITNLGSVDASDVLIYDQLPAGASLVSASSSLGTVESGGGAVVASLGTLSPNNGALLTVTVVTQASGILSNLVSGATSTADSNPALATSTWLTSVNNSSPTNQIAQLLLQVNDLVSNPTDGKLYASVSGSAAGVGDCVVAIDPLTLQISKPIPTGSEPGTLALSPDGLYLYVSVNTSAAINLIDLQSSSLTFQESLYPLALTEMFVLPGGAESLLLSQHLTNTIPSEAGVQIITGGSATTINDPNPVALIQPSLSSNIFYAYDNGRVPSAVSRVVIQGTNTFTTARGGLTLDTEPEFRSAGNLLFFAAGEVIDPESMVHLASFPGLSLAQNQICPDLASGRVYYLTINGSTATIAAYSLNDYQLAGSLQIAGVSGTPEQLVRWGTNGLAFATTGGQLFSIQTAMIPANAPADLVVSQSAPSLTTLMANYSLSVTVSNQGPGVATGATLQDVLPTGMRFLSGTASQGTVSGTGATLTASLGTLNAGAAAQVTIFLRPDMPGSTSNYVRVAANEPDPVMTNNWSVQPISVPFSQDLPLYIGDLVYDPTRGKVFATVHSAGQYSNSIIQIDPATGNVEQSLPTSFEPGKITVTDDGQFLYVGTTTAPTVARVNIAGWTNDLSFALGNDANNLAYVVGDFATLPGQPHSIVVSKHAYYGFYNPQVAIFDDGVMRPNIISSNGSGTYFIQVSTNDSILYTISTPYGVAGSFTPYTIDSGGIEAALTNLVGYNADFGIESNLLFTANGQVINLLNDSALGSYPVAGLVVPDLQDGLVFFLVQGGTSAGPTWALEAFSTNTATSIWQVTVPEATGTAYSLTRCGTNQFAFATTANQLFFVNTSVVPTEGDLVLSVTTNFAFAGGNLTNTFSILNDGPYSATGVTFSNVLASGSAFVSAHSTQGTCVQTNGIVTCPVGSMAGGAIVTISVVSRMTNSGSILLQASVSKNEPDLDPSNNQISSTEYIYPTTAVTVSNLTLYRQGGFSAAFKVVLAAPYTQPVQLFFTTSDGTALAHSDYTPLTKLISIPAGSTNASVNVAILNNGLVESNVVFYGNLSINSTASPFTTASCTLINYNYYAFSITNISLTAGSSGVTNATFFVKLSGSSSTPTSVDYFTRDGNAVSGRDYEGKAGTLLFAPGVTNASVSIPVYGISNSAPTRTFYLLLGNPVNSVLGASQASASILSTNPQSPIIISGMTVNGSDVMLQFPSASGAFYRLLTATNLSGSNWVTAIDQIPGTGGTVFLTDTNGLSGFSKFYRLLELP